MQLMPATAALYNPIDRWIKKLPLQQLSQMWKHSVISQPRYAIEILAKSFKCYKLNPQNMRINTWAEIFKS